MAKRVLSLRIDPDDLRRLRAAYPNPSEGLRQAVRFLVRLEDALAERLRAWTETLARLTGRAVPPFRVPVRFDPPARAWDGRDWVSAAALGAWAADRATRQAGIPVLENPHDVAAVWGLHVGRAFGLDEPRARALGGFCHEWLGAWADLSGEAREGADLALRVFASVLEGRIEPPTDLRLPPPPRRLFPTVAAEDPAYARAWRAVLRVLELMQAGRCRRLPFRDAEAWLLDGVPVDARAVLEAEGIDLAPAAGPRTFPARVHLFWYMPEGYRWNLVDLMAETPEAVPAVARILRPALSPTVVREVPDLIQWEAGDIGVDPAVFPDPPVRLPEIPYLPVAPLWVLAASKVATLAGRRTLRDFLLRAGFTLRELLSLADAKTPGFSAYDFARALREFRKQAGDPAEAEYWSMVMQPVTRDEMERVFREAVGRIERAYAKAGWLHPVRDPLEALRRDADSAILPYMDTDDD
jgi:hypothetical protein